LAFAFYRLDITKAYIFSQLKRQPGNDSQAKAGN
jgi:hypothetical protein